MSFLNNKRSMSSIKQVLALLGSCSEIQVQLRNSILSSSLQLDLLRPVRGKIMQILDQCPEIPNSIEDIEEIITSESREALVQFYVRNKKFQNEKTYAKLSNAQKTSSIIKSIQCNAQQPQNASPPSQSTSSVPENQSSFDEILKNFETANHTYEFLQFGKFLLQKMVSNFDFITSDVTDKVVDILTVRFIRVHTEDKLNDLVEFIHRQFDIGKDNITPEVVLASELLSVISHHPNNINQCRTPRYLSSLDSASELEDSNILRQVIFRFQLFGFGNRQNFLQMWTSLQQLICAQSITGLQVGEGGEEETELACLAVRGLATLQLQAACKLLPEADGRLFGCPVVTILERNSRCPTPRFIQAAAQSGAKIQNFVESDIHSTLFLEHKSESTPKWLSANVEEIGSSVNFLSQINSVGYFRKLGISPIVSFKKPDLDQESEIESEMDQSSQKRVWKPDLESSVQFLFDLFLRWLHFTKVNSDEKPNHR